MCYTISTLKERDKKIKKEEIKMTIKELFNYIEAENKWGKFMQHGWREVKAVKIDETAFKNDTFENAEDLVETINGEYYTDINEDTEIINNDGYIQIKITQHIPDYKYEGGELKKEIIDQEATINLYIDTDQEWD